MILKYMYVAHMSNYIHTCVLRYSTCKNTGNTYALILAKGSELQDSAM